MVIFRENTEDIYAGIEWAAESPEAKKVIAFLQNEMGVKKIRFPDTSGIGIKPVSREGSERLIRAALDYAILHKRKSVTLVHKGNIMKFTEGAFRDWGYALVKREYAGKAVGWDDCGGKPPAGQVLVKDSIADITLQQVLTRPDEFDVIATLNLNGDYLSATRWRRRSAASASRPAATSTTPPATPCSRRPTAPRPSTPTRTRSTPARSSSPA